MDSELGLEGAKLKRARELGVIMAADLLGIRESGSAACMRAPSSL